MEGDGMSEEDVCEKCGCGAPESCEEFDAEGWMMISGEQFCYRCGLERMGQMKLVAA
jgi:hypothetical protein